MNGTRSGELIGATDMQAYDLAEVLGWLDVGMFGEQFVNGLADGWQDLLKEGIADECRKIIERELIIKEKMSEI